jgi:beta-galactosidase
VVGQNYRENEILAAHESKPSRKILGTENGHDRKGWLALRDTRPMPANFSGAALITSANPDVGL